EGTVLPIGSVQRGEDDIHAYLLSIFYIEEYELVALLEMVHIPESFLFNIEDAAEARIFYDDRPLLDVPPSVTVDTDGHYIVFSGIKRRYDRRRRTERNVMLA